MYWRMHQTGDILKAVRRGGASSVATIPAAVLGADFVTEMTARGMRVMKSTDYCNPEFRLRGCEFFTSAP